MRIDEDNKVKEMYNANTRENKRKVDKTGGQDSVQISKQGRDIQIAKQAVKQASDIRTDKVEAIKKQMAEGTYQVSNKDVAEKMVESLFDQKI